MNWNIHQLLEELIQFNEHQRIEAKHGSNIGHSIMQTICAFANAALRAITDLDTLAASKILSRLWQQLHLIEKNGSGRSTYYHPSHLLMSYHIQQNENRTGLARNDNDLPNSSRAEIRQLTPKAQNVKPVILKLYLLYPCLAGVIVKIINRNISTLKKNRLSPTREERLLAYTFPEIRNHPQQAYLTSEQGKNKDYL